MKQALSSETQSGGPMTGLWIVLIGAASVALSRAFACATPFAALAMLAAFTLRGREASGLVLFVWLANQAIGFGLLHYPWTLSTVGWGVAIGVAALAGLIAASGVFRRGRLVTWVAVPLALVAAFSAYEAVLFAATWILPSASGVFASPVVLRIFAINAAAAFLLLGAHRLASLAGWPFDPRRGSGLPIAVA
jgi:hypothetical protein